MAIVRIDPIADPYGSKLYVIESPDTLDVYETGGLADNPGRVKDIKAVGNVFYHQAKYGVIGAVAAKVQDNRNYGHQLTTAFAKDKAVWYMLQSPERKEEFRNKVVAEVVKDISLRIEENIKSRLGPGGRFIEPAKARIISAFQVESRVGEPHLHLHQLSGNAVLDPFGLPKCGDFRLLYKRRTLRQIGEDAEMLMQRYMEQKLGVAFTKDGKVVGITREHELAFSTRRTEVLKEKEALRSARAKASDLAARKTRNDKAQLPANEEREAKNREKAAALGLTPESLKAAQDRAKKALFDLLKRQRVVEISWDNHRKLNWWFKVPREVHHVTADAKTRDEIQMYVGDGVDPGKVRTIQSLKASWKWKPPLHVAKHLVDNIDFSAKHRPVNTFLKSLETAVKPKDVFGKNNFVIITNPDHFSHNDLALALEKARRCTVFFMGERTKTLALAREREREKGQEMGR